MVSAQEAFKRGELSRAFRMGFEGYMMWLRRTGGRVGRADRYAEVIHKVLERDGPRTVLDRCVAVRTNFEEKACNLIFVQHLRRGTSGPAARRSAMRLFQEACLGRRQEHLADGCGKLPQWLARDPKTGPLVMQFLRKRCAGRKTRPSAACGSMAIAVWEAAHGRADVAKIAELGPSLIRLAGNQGAVKILEGLLDKRPKVAAAALHAFIQNVGTTEGFSQLASAFSESLDSGLQKALTGRYIDRLKGLIPELVTVLSMGDKRVALSVLDVIMRVGGPRARKVARKVRVVLTEPRDVALKAYLKAAVEDPALRRKAIQSLRGRRELLRAQVIAKLAGADRRMRIRYRHLLRELEPESALGSVEGRVLRSTPLLRRTLHKCRVQLVERRTCDGAKRTFPDGRGRKLGLASGGLKQLVKATVAADAQGRYRFSKIPAGPYDIFVKCPGLGWRRFTFRGYVRRGRRAKWVTRCLLTVPPLRTVTALTLNVDEGRPVLPMAPGFPRGTVVGPTGRRTGRGRRMGGGKRPRARPGARR